MSSINAAADRPKAAAVWQHGAMQRPGFKENLRHLMDSRGVNGAELAARVRVDPGAVSRWRSDGHLPSAQDFLAIARVLEVDPWLLIGSSFREPDPPRQVAHPGRRKKDAIVSKALNPSRKGPASSVQVAPKGQPSTNARRR